MSQVAQTRARELFDRGVRIEPYIDERDVEVSMESKEVIEELTRFCVNKEWEKLTATPAWYPQDTLNGIRLSTERITHNPYRDGIREDVIYGGPFGQDAFRAFWAINRCPAEEMRWREVDQWVCAEVTPYTASSAYGIGGKLLKYKFVYISANAQDVGLKEVILYHRP